MAAKKNRNTTSKHSGNGVFTIRWLDLLIKGPAPYFWIAAVAVVVGLSVWRWERPTQTVTASGPGSVAVMTNSGTISTGEASRSTASASEATASPTGAK